MAWGAVWPLRYVMPKIGDWYHAREGLFSRLPNVTGKRWIWVHVASSGELEQSIPVMERLKVEGYRICLTYFSPTAKKGIELEVARRQQYGLSPPWDFADCSPFDFGKTVNRFIEHFNFEAFVTFHRELWPGIILAAKKQKIRLYLLCFFISSAKKNALWFLRPLLEKFECIACIDSTSQQSLTAKLKRPEVMLMGDTRLLRAMSRKQLAPRTFSVSNIKVGIFASLWEEDFEAVLVALSEMGSFPKEWSYFFVPHELNSAFIRKLHNGLLAKGFQVEYWENWKQNPRAGVCVLVNQVGILVELYGVGQFAFVGGSFRKRVHNLIEPYVYGLPLVTGPFIKNSPNLELLNHSRALSVCQDATGLRDFIRRQRDGEWRSYTVNLDGIEVEKVVQKIKKGGETKVSPPLAHH